MVGRFIFSIQAVGLEVGFSGISRYDCVLSSGFIPSTIKFMASFIFAS